MIDDYLPFYTNNNKVLIFDSLPVTNALWAPFLEKVWAKVNGYYERIIAGSADEVFRFFNGLPTTVTFRGDATWLSATDIWNIISSADYNQYIITAGVPGGSNSYNLIKNHAYTILSAHIIYNSDGTEKAKLFRVRNPWSQDAGYSGKWNDNDPDWLDTKNKYAS